MANLKNETGYVDSDYLNLLGDVVTGIKKRSYHWMHLKPGFSVLDVGCGPGIDTLALAKIVGSSGQVVGVDHDKEMISLATKKALVSRVSGWVKYELTDAMALTYNDNHFDACRCERFIQHVEDPPKAIAEMVRVTKPGGWVVAVDTDHSSFSTNIADIDLEWRLRRFKADSFTNGYAGRQLYSLLKQNNLIDVTIEGFPIFFTNYDLAKYFTKADEIEQKAVEAGAITPQELTHWQNTLQQAYDKGQFFASININLVAGKKP